jgi:hypothetical protein
MPVIPKKSTPLSSSFMIDSIYFLSTSSLLLAYWYLADHFSYCSCLNYFFVITSVLSPVMERSLHYSSMNPFFCRLLTKFFIMESAPFRYNVIWFVCVFFTMIPILLVSLLNGNMFNIWYLSYFSEGNIIVMSVCVLDFNMIPNFSTIFTNVISSGLEAWNYLSLYFCDLETMLSIMIGSSAFY